MIPLLLKGGESYDNQYFNFLLLVEEEYSRLVGREVVDFFISFLGLKRIKKLVVS
jgi:hypothetical protein